MSKVTTKPYITPVELRNSKGNTVDISSDGQLVISITDPKTAFGQVAIAEETPLIVESFPYYLSDLKLDRKNLVTNSPTSTSGSGINFTVAYESSFGIVQKVAPHARGSGYAVGDSITLTAGNADATCTVKSVDETNQGVLALSLTAGGTGYTDSLASSKQGNNMMTLTTDTTADSKACVRTKRRAKYHPGEGIICRFTGIFSAGTSGSNQYIGIGDENNGFFVGYQGTSFGVLRRSEGVETWTPRASFNVDQLDGNGVSGMTADFQKGNVYKIQYEWLGFGSITFSIENPVDASLQEFHVIKYGGTNTLPSCYLPTLPISWEIENTTNTTALSLSTASAMAAIEGKEQFTGNRFGAIATGGNYLMSLRNLSYFYDKVNTIQAVISTIGLNNDDNSGAANYTLTLNGSLSGAPSWTSIDGTNSSVQQDTSATSVSGGSVIRNFTLAKNSSINLQVDLGEIIIYPGDVLTLTSDNATTQAASINWIENV